MAENEQTKPADEPDRAWRERTQETNELAKKLAPPHDPEAERGAPTPSDEAEDQAHG
jgi:hypothetical protein